MSYEIFGGKVALWASPWENEAFDFVILNSSHL